MAEQINPLAQSDEEFLKQNPPDGSESVKEEPVQDTKEDKQDAEPSSNEPVKDEPKDDKDTKDEDGNKGESKDIPAVQEPKEDKDNTADTKDVELAKEVSTAPNYEEFYKKVMAPFKANGKTITLKTPEEAIQLMQQGANFTKKMQSIAPYRKVLQMLQKNNLLDENRINYLIDLNNKNPEAIKHLVKDANIDPVDIDTNDQSTYVPNNYRVSDSEALFTEILDEYKTDPQGLQTLQVINAWDEGSKNKIFNDPNLIRTIHSQRLMPCMFDKSKSVFDYISDEVEKQRVLGNIPTNVSFLDAYKQVGDYLVQQMQQNVQRQPLETRKETPKSQVTNSAKAKAAAPTRSNKNKTQNTINPLAMSDEEFMKLMESRV